VVDRVDREVSTGLLIVALWKHWMMTLVVVVVVLLM
jgi:hypothetical protein